MTKDLLQLAGVSVQQIRQLQNELDPIRRQRLDSLGFEVGILESVNGSIHAGAGNYWASLPSGLDDNGFATYTPPFKVRGGTSQLWETRGHPILIRTAYDGRKEVFGTDAPTFEAAGGNMRVFNLLRPEESLVYLNNVARLQCRSLSNTNTTSTLVNVQRLWYEDNYGNINRWEGTDLLADKPDLAEHIPDADKHRIVVVFLRTIDNTLQVTASTTIRDLDDPIVNPDDYQECFDQRDAETVPIQAYELKNAETSVSIDSLDIDLRQFINMPPVLGFPNPADKQWILREGQQLTLHNGQEFTAGFEILGDLEIIGEPVVTTYSGHMYQDDAATVVTISGMSTDVIVDGYSLRSTRNMGWQNTQEYVITKAGEYDIEWSLSFQMVAGANQEIEAAIGVNGTRDPAASSHRKIGTATDTGSMSGLDTVILAVGDLVQLMVRNETSTNNVIVEHSQVRIKKTETKVG